MTASASAIGTDAAEVLPYFWTFVYIRSIGRFRPFATASMMRTLAWCGMKSATSLGSRPDLRTDSSAVVAIVFVAKRYVSLPSIRM